MEGLFVFGKSTKFPDPFKYCHLLTATFVTVADNVILFTPTKLLEESYKNVDSPVMYADFISEALVISEKVMVFYVVIGTLKRGSV